MWYHSIHLTIHTPFTYTTPLHANHYYYSYKDGWLIPLDDSVCYTCTAISHCTGELCLKPIQHTIMVAMWSLYDCTWPNSWSTVHALFHAACMCLTHAIYGTCMQDTCDRLIQERSLEFEIEVAIISFIHVMTLHQIGRLMQGKRFRG